MLYPRIFGLSALLTATVAYGGQIQIGGANGLTSAVTSVSSTGTNAGLDSYTSTLFTGQIGVTGNASGNTGTILPSTSMPSTNLPNGEPTGTNSTPIGESLTADGVTFSMINTGAGGSGNYWGAASGAGTSTTITTAIGLEGVDEVWTMLNDQYGLAGSSPVSVTFNFSSAGATGAIDDSIAFTLVNGTVYRDANDCSTGGPVTPNCSTTFATGLSSGSYSTSGTLISGTPTAPSVSAFTVWAGSYSGNTTANNSYEGTTGNLNLDAQAFSFADAGFNELSQYLVNVVVTDSNTAAKQTRVGLSAITVDQATDPAPEPSTVLLFMTGFGVLGFAHRRLRS
jgi:hypothetical protein